MTDNSVLLGKIKDVARQLYFVVQLNKRRTLYRLLNNAKTTEDIYNVANQIVVPHQIKSEILSFIDFAKQFKPKVVCEIGTADGGNSFMFEHTFCDLEKIFLIDLYIKNKLILKAFKNNNYIQHFISGSSYHKTTLKKVVKKLDKNKIDLLFIDGDHSLDGVKADFELYKDFVREGGLIAFHDIIPDRKTGENNKQGKWVGDVPKFWQSIKNNYINYEFIENPEQIGAGIGVIINAN